jgi:hypothetical protein
MGLTIVLSMTHISCPDHPICQREIAHDCSLLHPYFILQSAKEDFALRELEIIVQLWRIS